MPTLADLWLAIQEAHLVDDPVYAALVNAVSEPCRGGTASLQLSDGEAADALWNAVMEDTLSSVHREGTHMKVIDAADDYAQIRFGKSAISAAFPKLGHASNCPACNGTRRVPRLYPDVPGAVSGAIGAAVDTMFEPEQIDEHWSRVQDKAVLFDDPATIAATLAAIEEEVAHDA